VPGCIPNTKRESSKRGNSPTKSGRMVYILLASP